MSKWSKLKNRIEDLFVPNLGMNIECNVFIYNIFWRITIDPTIWITLDKKIIFDFIKDSKGLPVIPIPEYGVAYQGKGKNCRVYLRSFPKIIDIIYEYIKTPKNVLFDRVFEHDYFGLTDVLKAADRRIGKKKLLLLKEKTQSKAVKKIIDKRLGVTEPIEN